MRSILKFSERPAAGFWKLLQKSGGANDSERESQDIGKYSFKFEKPVLDDLYESFGYSGELGTIYALQTELTVHKWHHYIPIYEKQLKKFKGRDIRFLEIGVYKGGSLEMWRKYLGSEADIYGIDIDKSCLEFSGKHGQVRIGSQDDKDFLLSVISEMGGLDIVIDDGSHDMKHVHQTLQILFPLMNDGGVYIVEDLHTAFWRRFNGGFDSKHNFFSTLFLLSKDMHSWYHGRQRVLPSISNKLAGIHIYDSLVVLDKAKMFPPTHSELI